MKTGLIVVLLAGLLWLSETTYRLFLRPVDPPTATMLALADHFNARGIKGHIYAVRHGYRHSEMTAAAAFQIDGFPLPISFDDCPNEVAAEALYQAIQRSPNLTHPQRNGTLVLNLPMWGDDTDAMAARVREAFGTFRPAR
ncbi:hypothetical protein [Roseateles sp. P5_E7]